MAFSSVAGGSNNRRRTTRTNYGGMSPGQRRRSLLGNTAANDAASERFRRRRTTQAANTTPDPLTNAIAGGSTGLSNADVMNMMGGTQGLVPVNTSQTNADVMEEVVNTQGAVPANAPPPPPPPNPNQQYADQFSKSTVQTTAPDPNQQYADQFSKSTVQTTPPKLSNADVMNMMGNTQGAVPTNTPKSPLDGSVIPMGRPDSVLNPQFVTSNVATTPPNPNQQYADAFSKSTVQTTPFEPPEKLSRPEIELMMGNTQGEIVTGEDVERRRSELPDLSKLVVDPYTPPPDPNQQYTDAFSKSTVQTTAPDPNQQYTDAFSKSTVQTTGGLSTFSTEDNIEDIMEKTQGAIADTKDADLEKQLREQAGMAARQGSGLTTYTAKDPALSFTVDPTTGLRTFAGASELNPNAVG